MGPPLILSVRARLPRGAKLFQLPFVNINDFYDVCVSKKTVSPKWALLRILSAFSSLSRALPDLERTGWLRGDPLGKTLCPPSKMPTPQAVLAAETAMSLAMKMGRCIETSVCDELTPTSSTLSLPTEALLFLSRPWTCQTLQSCIHRFYLLSCICPNLDAVGSAIPRWRDQACSTLLCSPSRG